MSFQIRLSLPDEMVSELERVRKNRFPEKSYQELLRLMIWRGLSRKDQRDKEEEQHAREA